MTLRLPRLSLLFAALSAAVVVMCLLAQPARAQAIRLRLVQAPMQEALLSLQTQAGIDLVFARSLVANKVSSCTYAGSSAEEALACVLAGSGLKAESVRRRQYVIVRAPAPRPATERPARTFGQMSGFISDAASGETLPNASVYLTDLKLGASTNVAGYFAIPGLPLGEYRLQVRYLGYALVDTVLAASSKPYTIRLQPSALLSEEVIVEEDREQISSAQAIGAMALPLTDLEQIPSFPGEQDLFQSLQWLPGIHRSGEISGGLLIRGGEPDQNLYLIDGAPIYHPWHAFSLISTFQTETFKDARLYRGLFPAEFGGRLAAVLDAQMKDGNRNEPRVVGALSLLSGRMLLESPVTANSSFMFSARRSYIDKLIGSQHPVRHDDGRLDTLRTGYYFYDLSAKLTIRPHPHHHLALSHYRGRDNLDVRLPFELSLDWSDWKHPAELFFDVEQNWENHLYSARHQFLLSDRLFWTNTVYYSGYYAREGAFIQPSMSATLNSDYDVNLHDTGFRSDVDYYYRRDHQLRFGVHAVNRTFESLIDAEIERSVGSVDSLGQYSRLHAWEAVGYVQDLWQPSSRWQVAAGTRISHFSGSNYFGFTPRLNARYTVVPGSLVLQGGAGTALQYIHRLRDRYSFMYDLVSSRWIPASASVRPAWSAQVALGAEGAWQKWLSYGIESYYRFSKDVLIPADEYRTKDGLEGPGIEVGTLLGQYAPARARAYGVELSARAQRGDWLLWASYVYGRTYNRLMANDGQEYRPGRFDAPQAFRGVLLRRLGRWSFTLSGEARSGYPYSAPSARYVVGDVLDEGPASYLYRPSINNGRLPGYWRMDASATYRFGMLGARWRAQLQAYNLFDRRNVINRQFVPGREMLEPSDRRSIPFIPLFEIEMEL